MVLDPIPQSLPVYFFGSRPQPPTSQHLAIPIASSRVRERERERERERKRERERHTHIHQHTLCPSKCEASRYSNCLPQSVCVCLCVCVCDRERERERERERHTYTHTHTQTHTHTLLVPPNVKRIWRGQVTVQSSHSSNCEEIQMYFIFRVSVISLF